MLPPHVEPQSGRLAWIDLTVPDAEALRQFYEQVVGWKADALSMGEYSDYTMTPPGADAPVAGVCHARGGNASLPPVWLPYFLVADLEKSIAEALAREAQVIKGPTPYGDAGKWCALRDPAGAAFALFQSGAA